MIQCDKQQREDYKGESQFRCIHKEADTYLEVIELSVCDGCPLAKISKKLPKKCGQLPIVDKNLSVKNQKSMLDSRVGYPSCPYREGPTDKPICTVTGLGVTPKICGQCDKDVRDYSASLGGKFVNFYGAIRKWIAAGMPTRTEEEIQEIFETHCKRCDRYDKEKHACENCGCAVSTSSEPLKNKLAMATEVCPLGRF